MVKEVEQALARFSIAEPRNVERIAEGLIHRTYRVDTAGGSFCLQRLHPKLSSDEILEDYEAVTTHLHHEGFPAPRLVQTRRQKLAADVDGHRWRLTTWLEGTSTGQVTSTHQAHQAGGLLARFHRAAQKIAHRFLSTHPLHDTPLHARLLSEAIETERKKPARERSGWLERVEPLGRKALEGTSRLALPLSGLPRRVVHGDPKISNILFDPHTGRACGLVDLDTCTRHTVLVDLGDAIRSWSPQGTEESVGRFRLEIVEAMLEGYAAQAAPLEEPELATIPRCGPLITWELCSRFVRDTLEDSYFGWDRSRYPSRRAHNFARASAMAELAERMEAGRHQLDDLVKKLFCRKK
jgi:Ser/Thr protein kinase RdoA (MazF antagonist)